MTSIPPLDRPQQGDDLSRMMALSDGLFAIALTLLVLDLKPQATTPGHWYDALVQLWPRLFAFYLTFLVGGSYWISHHSDLQMMRGYNRTCLWLNLMFLLPVSLLPFSTALIGENTNTATWSLYSINVIAIGLTLTALWRYIGIMGLIEPSPSGADQQFLLARHLVVPGVFAVSIPLSFVAPSMAPYTALLIPLVLRVYARLTGWKEPARPPRPRAASIWVVVGFTPILLFAVWTIWLSFSGTLSGGTGSP